LIVQGIAYINNTLFERVSIFIDEDSGKIIDIKVGYNIQASDKVIDVTKNRYRILPGFIDLHVHLRDLAYSYKEDYYTGTGAAAKGGIVLVCDMPNTKPPTNTLDNLKLKVNKARSKALVDYGLYYGSPKDTRELKYVTNHIVGFKFYPEDIFTYFDKNVFGEVANKAANNDLLLVFHAEDPRLFNQRAPPGLERTDIAEYSAIDNIINITRNLLRHKVKIHITHISSAKSLQLLLKTKKQYYNEFEVTWDVTPHHILLDNTMYRINAGLYKVYPTLKTRYDNMRLYLALLNNEVDAITTDHAPHSLNEKMRPYNEACPGYPGLETVVSLLLTMVNKDLLSLESVVRYYSYNPARILNLKGLYGVISKGAYASLTIVDLKAEWKVKAEDFVSKAKYSPFEGWSLQGKPYLTMVRGKIVFHDNMLYGELRGWGKNVRELAKTKS